MVRNLPFLDLLGFYQIWRADLSDRHILEPRLTLEIKMFGQTVVVIYPVRHLRPGGDPLTQIPQHPNDDHAGLQPVGTSLQKDGTLTRKSQSSNSQWLK